MYPVRRHALLLLVPLILAGCGSSLTQVTPRTAGPTAAKATTPFCDAIEQSREATEPVSRWRVGQQVEGVAEVADQVRAANQQVVSLAPQELRADVERVTGVVDRQLRLLEDNGGDTLVLSRDAELAQAASDPAYTASSRRISDYVRSSC